MKNSELEKRREQLRRKCETVGGLSPMLAMGEFKLAAMMMADITDELVRRELAREGGRE